MTREREREKAIRYLEICKKYIDKIRASEGVEASKEVCRALDLATRALEQEPCEDTVSRQVVKEQMLRYGFHALDMTVTEFVEDLPPVIPKHEGNTVSEEVEVYSEEYMRIELI